MTLDMNNQTYSSPRQKSVEEANRKRALEWMAGKWPPEGHPWQPLLRRPVEEVRQFFRGETFHALLQGLERLRGHANGVALDTSKPQPLRDEACGNVGAYDLIIGLADDILGTLKEMEKYGTLEQK